MIDPSIVIRPLERKDRAAATQFVTRMMNWTTKNFKEGGAPKGSASHLRATVVRTLDVSLRDPGHFCVLAQRQGKVIGIALGHILGGVGRIDWMAVDPTLHRQGIGKKLVAAVEDLMKKSGCHKITLYISESHTPAIGLYLNWGMVQEGKLKNHEWGRDYVVMSKWIEKRK